MGLAVGDIVQVSWRGTSMAQKMMLVRNYVLSGGGGNAGNSVPDDLSQLGTEISVGGAKDITTAFLNVMPSNYDLFEVRCQVIAPERSVLVDTFAGPAAGTEGTAANVPNDAAVVTFRTDIAGRKQVANIHLGPLPSDAATQGQLTAGYNAKLLTLVDKLTTAIQPLAWAGTLKPIILHRPAMTWNLITNFQIQPQARVMVRRTLNRGI